MVIPDGAAGVPMNRHRAVAGEVAQCLSLGRPVVLIANTRDHPPAQLVLAAELATAATIAFLVRHGSGFIRVAVMDEDADRLDVPAMHLPTSRASDERDCVAVDARHDVSTGISARDRARTVNLLATPTSTPQDFTRPGHVVPVRVNIPSARTSIGSPLGFAINMAIAAGLRPAVAACALVSSENPTGLATVSEARAFAANHGLMVAVAGPTPAAGALDELPSWYYQAPLLVGPN